MGARERCLHVVDIYFCKAGGRCHSAGLLSACMSRDGERFLVHCGKRKEFESSEERRDARRLAKWSMSPLNSYPSIRDSNTMHKKYVGYSTRILMVPLHMPEPLRWICVHRRDFARQHDGRGLQMHFYTRRSFPSGNIPSVSSHCLCILFFGSVWNGRKETPHRA